MPNHSLASGRWHHFSLSEQLANIGSEVGRAIKWKATHPQRSQMAFWRALGLIDLTLSDPKHQQAKRLKEITRTREALVDFFVGRNEYKTTSEIWDRYFNFFNLIARSG